MTDEDTLEISISAWFLGAIVLAIGVLFPLLVIIGKNKKVFRNIFKFCNSNKKTSNSSIVE